MESFQLQFDIDFLNKGYMYLGWQNGGLKNQEIVDKCREQEHRRCEKQHTRSGSDNTVWRDSCRYFYKYDCS